MKLAFLSIASVALASCALGQAQAQQILLRMERVQMGEAVCVLVQDDGNYRLEKLYRAKTDMYAGTVEAERLDQLRLLLRDDKLRKLSEGDISRRLMTDTVDSLELSIWRDRGWQNLDFFSPADRRPFKESIDPLLKWFQDVVKKRPSAALVGGTPTRCLPASSATLSAEVKTPHPVPVSPTSHFEPGYLFRFQSTEFHAGVAERKCVVVFSDGTYRWEERTENFAGRKRGRAGTGDVDGTALQELKQVLDSPDLKNAADGTAPHVLAQNWQGAVLDVPRDNDVQHVRLDSAFNTHGNPREAGGMSNLGYQVNSQKVLDPLKHWMKQHTSKHDGAVEDMGSNCDPGRAPPKP
jgi:hypothetical protein